MPHKKPIDKPKGKPLYQPFTSKAKGAKYAVYVKGTNNKPKLINFGAKGYNDFKSGTASKQDRAAYLTRAKAIKKKDGSLAYRDKNSPSYWSVRHQWKG